MPVLQSEIVKYTYDDCNNYGEQFFSHLITTYKSPLVKRAEHALRRTQPGIFVPPTAFEASTKDERYWVKGYRRYGYRCIGTTLVAVYKPVENFQTAVIAELQARAVTRALEELKSQKVNYAVAFAERQQTARLVGNSAEKIFRAALALKKGKFSDAAAALGVSKNLFKPGKGKKHSDFIGNRWLELQYGWKPLLNDVYGSMAELADKDNKQKDRYRVTVRGSARNNATSIYNSSVSGQEGDRNVVKIEHSVRCRLDYNYTNPVTGTLARLGITDPATVAWELMPWSFVADWFIPIGGYLSALNAATGYSFLGGSSTYRGTCGVTGFDLGPLGYASNPAFPNAASFPLRVGSYSGKFIRRIAYSSSPLPRFPGFKNPLSLHHLANSIALLAGSVKVR